MSITGQRLRLLRAERKWSQEAVAKKLGISRTAYNKYENGAIHPVRKLKELADYHMDVMEDDMQISEDLHMIFDHMMYFVFNFNIVFAVFN